MTKEEASISRYEKGVAPASQIIDAFLRRVGIPRAIIDKMNETPPTDIFILTNSWVIDQGVETALKFRPGFIDAAENKCGRNPEGGEYVTGSKRYGATDEDLNRWDECVGDLRQKNQDMERERIRALVMGRSSAQPIGKQEPQSNPRR